jgi:hypothetical protein
MRPNQFKTLSYLIKALGLIIAIYFVFCHPLFTLISLLCLIVLVLLLIKNLDKISEFIEDLTDGFNKK